jgi:hypothetical protein
MIIRILKDNNNNNNKNNNVVYLNKLQRKKLQSLFSTWIMHTSQYGISIENKSTNNKSYRYNTSAQW